MNVTALTTTVILKALQRPIRLVYQAYISKLGLNSVSVTSHLANEPFVSHAYVACICYGCVNSLTELASADHCVLPTK